MTTTLYYFTATGNSFQIARKVANSIENSTLLPIIGTLDEETIDPGSDVVGFVFPQHASGLPRIVAQFIEKLTFRTTEYIFAIVTCMHARGLSMGQFNQMLISKKRILNAGFFIPMPVNYIIGFDPPPIEEQRKIIARATEKLTEVVDSISRRKRHVEGDGFPVKILSRFSHVYRTRLRSLSTLDYNFSVTERCDQCGTCELVCPVNNVTLVERVPTWQHRCEQCLSCINLCPTQAIEYGMETQGRTRYKNPDISLSEIIHQKEKRESQ